MAWYRVTKDEVGIYDAKEIGWNWFGALFLEYYLLAKGLYKPLFRYLGIIVVMRVVISSFAGSDSSAGSWFILLGVIVRIIASLEIGSNVNYWIIERDGLKYSLVGDIEAIDANTAVQHFVDKELSLKRPQQKQEAAPEVDVPKPREPQRISI